MSGGERYWNEDTQRWEEGAGAGGAAGATPPPRPDHAPPTRPAWPPAGEPREPAASEQSPADPAPTPPASDWPRAGDSGESPAAERPSVDRPTAPPAPAWPPAGESSAPPAPAWPPAGESSAPPAPAWPPAGESQGLPAPAWPPADDSPAPPAAPWPPAGQSPTAAWPPADHPAPPTAPWPSTDPASTTADWPPVDLSEPSEPPAKGPSRRVLWSVIVGAAAAGVAVSLVLALVVGKDDSDDRGPVARRTPSAPATSAQETSADPSPSPSPSPSGPPAGYAVRDDSEGFRTAVPEGWTRASVPSEHGISVVNFRSPDRERRLQVYEVSEASPDASFELYLSPETAKPRGFEQLSLRNLDEGDFTGSRLEYLADTIRDEPEVGTWHVYDERFVASDGKIYALAAYGADADGRDDELELLTTALAWFCPPGMNCDDDGNAALD
ncbi:hypothetical protein [Streptomyces seoulensis]|uniref:hypothetical protein n=1 Tax=Streptomyces seoulensis TaxID=73044 RepID=UPI001FCBB8CE|nr:hypothetical protein [Streptomyces seoulensis]BDH08239.1 hypothetical protein HEK131_54660 [Streptomyces seoulensis]